MTENSLEYWQRRVAYWSHELAKNEKLLRGFALGTPPLGVVATVVASHYSVAATATTGLTAVLVLSMGLYMIIVRRYEFRGYIDEAAKHVADMSDGRG